MSHIRILRLHEGASTGKGKSKTTSIEGVTVEPGTFGSHREALDSIKESGEYLLLESHQVVRRKKKTEAEDEEPNE